MNGQDPPALVSCSILLSDGCGIVFENASTIGHEGVDYTNFCLQRSSLLCI